MSFISFQMLTVFTRFPTQISCSLDYYKQFQCLHTLLRHFGKYREIETTVSDEMYVKMIYLEINDCK